MQNEYARLLQQQDI